MGSKYVEGRSVEFSKSYEESSPSTPIFFILSPGVDPLKDVEALGKCLGHQGAQSKAPGRRPSTPSGRPWSNTRAATVLGGVETPEPWCIAGRDAQRGSHGGGHKTQHLHPKTLKQVSQQAPRIPNGHHLTSRHSQSSPSTRWHITRP